MLLINGMILDTGIIIHEILGIHLGKTYFPHLGHRGDNMRNLPTTLICYYRGNYGSTIRINAKTKEWLEDFRKNILLLAEGGMQEIRIDCLDGIEIIDSISLTLIKSQRIKHPKISILNNCFTWSQNTEELITIMGLIDGLLDSDKPGHQYLTNEGDDVLIILSYDE